MNIITQPIRCKIGWHTLWVLVLLQLFGQPGIHSVSTCHKLDGRTRYQLDHIFSALLFRVHGIDRNRDLFLADATGQV